MTRLDDSRSPDVALREVRFGRIWRANAYRLVEERDGVLVLWSPPGNPRLVPVDSAGAEIRLPVDEPCVLGTRTTEHHTLSLVRPGARYSDGSVRWKDEDELDEAAAEGLLDAAEVRAEADRVLATPPWPTGWETWRPDPSWPAPALPDGWDVV